ncbi:MAG: hypothetical protein ACXWUP_06780 [Allosphingosinicella sp.]
MRLLPPALLTLGLLTACAGNVADYVGPRTEIIEPQLARYGLDPTETACVAGSLAASLTPLQLRLLSRSAAVVQQGYFDPARLTMRDLNHVASTMNDPQIRLELTRAAEACHVGIEAAAAEAAAAAAPVPDASASAPTAEWLNLGSAPTGQSISVDAGTLEREPTARKAWFRLTNPNEAVTTGISYLLRINCTARTIEALAHRRQDAAGALAEYHEYAQDAEGPLPIEGGTVMEIAFLALCT